MPHSTHGVIGADGGKKKYLLNTSQKKKFYPLGTTDEYFEVPYEEYPITICGQTVILTNGELAAASTELHETTGKLKAVESTLQEKKDLQKQLLAYIKIKPDPSGSQPDRERQNFLHFFYFFISHEQSRRA